MDPITHGITGALLGKAYFSKREARVSIFAATLGAVFSDVDVVAEAISRDPLAIIKYHRGITHSFVALPFFAALLAWLTRWAARRFKLESPSWAMLTLIYGVGLASHIILDGMTSFGTRMWTPISSTRVAWDLLFIIDFTFTSIALLPQVIAWIYADRARSAFRAALMWIIFTAAAFLAWRITIAFDVEFHVWVLLAASAIFAVLFFFPAIRAWGFGVSRVSWCRAGTYVMVAYLFACGLAHHAALARVRAFADANHIVVERIAALPVPPSLFEWGDAIRTSKGVYAARFDLRDRNPPFFRFSPDSPPDAFTARALELPEVRLYWNFARFPVIHSFAEGDHHIVQFGENRFVDRRRGGPQPFTYDVIFDSSGNVVEQGWLTNGMLIRNMLRVAPKKSDGAR
ncbi:MAG TPA: metal-dependent hydrolase [Candidatus Limnocylindrales bacterium]|nr:metal-dependent hydrolase [Candidatus Limnocylindrales bacterium]